MVQSAVITILMLTATASSAFLISTRKEFTPLVAVRSRCKVVSSSSAIFYINDSQDMQPEAQSDFDLSQPSVRAGDDFSQNSEPLVDIDPISSPLKQLLSDQERAENLQVIRKHRKDLRELHLKGDQAGWMFASKDKKLRLEKDPWFDLNEKMKKAYDSDNICDIMNLSQMIEKIGGAPQGIDMKENPGYATDEEIHDMGMSLEVSESIIAYDEAEQDRKGIKYHMYTEMEERRKAAEKEALEICKRNEIDPYERVNVLQKAMDMFNEEMSGKTPTKLTNLKDVYLAKKEEQEIKNKIEGDDDIQMADVQYKDEGSLKISSALKNNVKVTVSTDYVSTQSNPELRKHCFKYNICITNKSDTDTIQIITRSFLIQTVGSTFKDRIFGEGIMGEKRMLKPGEKFQYASTAPFNVRPLGTTPVAARMSGTYFFNIIDEASGNIISDENQPLEADLSAFHFVFPGDERVQPYMSAREDEDDDYEDDDYEDDDYEDDK